MPDASIPGEKCGLRVVRLIPDSLDQHGDTARLRPWVEALRAHHLGDRRALQNIAPEIRTAAEIFFDGIEARQRKLPDKTRRRPPAKPRRTRSKRF